MPNSSNRSFFCFTSPLLFTVGILFLSTALFSCANNNNNTEQTLMSKLPPAASKDTIDWATWNISYNPGTGRTTVEESQQESRELFYNELAAFNSRHNVHMDTMFIWTSRDTSNYLMQARIIRLLIERSRLDSAGETKPPAPRPGPRLVASATVDVGG